MNDRRDMMAARLMAPAASPVQRREFPVAPEPMIPPGVATMQAPSQNFPLDPIASRENPLAAFMQDRGFPMTESAADRLTTQGVDAATNWAGTTPMRGIRAFHGSPHDFDRFRMDRIGTGEGAQAYGHGLYFAGNEAVARNYRAAGVNSAIARLDGTPIADIPNKSGVLDWLDSYGSIANTRVALEGRRPELLRELDELVSTGRLREGNMYEVNLNVDPARLLDWDAPLSAQAPEVRGALGRVPWADAYVNSQTLTGGQIVPQTAEGAAQLREAGIPGIRYLDQGSRATSGGELLGVTQGANGWQARIRVDNRGGVGFASPTQQITTSRPFPTQAEAQTWADNQIGGGTRNYVMFDDSLIEILRKYGWAGLGLALGVQGGDAEAAPQ